MAARSARLRVRSTSRLPRVTLTVAAPAQGQAVLLDGAVLGPAAWGRPAPLDPGPHELVAEAAGKKTWRLRLDLAEGEQKVLAIPALEDDAQQAGLASPGASGTTAPRDAGAHPGDPGGQRTLGFIVGGAGVVLLGVGGFFGLQALSKKSESDDRCPTDSTCTKEGVALNDEANTAAWIANAGVGLGLVGVGIGTYLILSAGPDEAPPPRSARRYWLDAGATSQGGAVTLGGAW